MWNYCPLLPTVCKARCISFCLKVQDDANYEEDHDDEDDSYDSGVPFLAIWFTITGP